MNITPIDRNLQKEILKHLVQYYPETPQGLLPDEIKYIDERKLRSNLYYLYEIGLIDFKDSRNTDWHEPDGFWKISILRARQPSVDIFLNDDGVDGLMSEIMKSVSESNEKPEVIKHTFNLLGSLSGEAKSQLIKKLVSSSIDSAPGIAARIMNILQQMF